ncbi:MAG TPA: site-2 protease family protein [Ktedonobacterales bacterium]
MFGSFSLGKIGGIPVKVNASWLFIFALLAGSLAIGWFPVVLPGLAGAGYWALGVIGALLLFVSVLLHEGAHALVARHRGLPVSDITLFLFGGATNLREEPHTPWGEFVIAVVGPLTSLGIGIICWVAGVALGAGAAIVAVELLYLGLTNVLIGVFNLIPSFPLDGGRVLRAILWALGGSPRRASHWTLRVSQVIATLFILGALWRFVAGQFLLGLWLGFIGWFLLVSAIAASSERALSARLRQGTVGQIMNPQPIAVPANLSLERLIHEYFLPRGLRVAAVVQLGELIGLVSLGDVRHWPRDQWATVPVSYVMTPITRLITVHAEARLPEAIHLMDEFAVDQLPVISAGRLVGMLRRDAVARALAGERSAPSPLMEARHIEAELNAPPAEHPDQPRRPTLRLPRAS